MPTLQLGTFDFPRLPREGLDFDMKRRIAKLDPAGAPAVYQDMGLGEKTLQLRGTFDTEDAWATSQEIERLIWIGGELMLRYDDIQKIVRIDSYSPKLIRKNRVDYTLHLIVCFPESELESMGASASGSALSTQGSAGGGAAADLGGLLDSTYTIKGGDTLWKVAEEHLGDPTKWAVLAAGNSIQDERNLQIGLVIRVPSPGNKSSAIVAYENGNLAALGPTGKQEIDDLMKGVA